MTRTFGPYTLTVEGEHITITRLDGEPCEPTWYELQHMARMAWGSHATAIEIFPPSAEVYDTRHKRHLWHVPADVVARMPRLVPGSWREAWT